MLKIISHYKIKVFVRGGLNGGGGFHEHKTMQAPVVEFGHLIVDEGLQKFSYNLADVTKWSSCAISEDK